MIRLLPFHTWQQSAVHALQEDHQQTVHEQQTSRKGFVAHCICAGRGHSSTQHSAAQHSTAQRSAAQHSTDLRRGCRADCISAGKGSSSSTVRRDAAALASAIVSMSIPVSFRTLCLARLRCSGGWGGCIPVGGCCWSCPANVLAQITDNESVEDSLISYIA